MEQRNSNANAKQQKSVVRTHRTWTRALSQDERDLRFMTLLKNVLINDGSVSGAFNKLACVVPGQMHSIVRPLCGACDGAAEDDLNLIGEHKETGHFGSDLTK
jgi:hypothetical protein